MWHTVTQCNYLSSQSHSKDIQALLECMASGFECTNEWTEPGRMYIRIFNSSPVQNNVFLSQRILLRASVLWQ